jgi:hypothetical protein
MTEVTSRVLMIGLLKLCAASSADYLPIVADWLNDAAPGTFRSRASKLRQVGMVKQQDSVD